MNSRTTELLTAAIIVYCGWNASNLFTVSGISFESYQWIPLVIWAIPVFNSLISIRSFRGNTYLLGLALAISFLSSIADLNVLAHIGFALALMSLLPVKGSLIPWYLAAIAWMPAFSYFGARYFPASVIWLRFLIAICGCLWALWIINRRKP
jgi:hypothetical protein